MAAVRSVRRHRQRSRAWFIHLFYPTLYVESLVNELTTFAAFTALLVFLFAIIGVTIGRGLVDRKAPERASTRAAEEDRADTDVFAAVRQPGDDDDHRLPRRRERRRRD